MHLLSLFATIAAVHAEAPAPTHAVVVDVYDGDTLTLNNGDKVRLRGVNTPELRPAEAYGIEAREAAKNLVLQREVILTYGEVKRDGYGRLLASVKLKDGTDLATHLLELGLGHLFLIPPEELDVTTLRNAQQIAKAGGLGIWSNAREESVLRITSFHANGDGDDNRNVNGEYLRVCNISNKPVELNGYTIRDISGRSWTLPAMIVPVGHTFKLHSGTNPDRYSGEAHQTDPSRQLEVYLGESRQIWDNTRDHATIYDRHNNLVDERHHEPKNPPRN